MVELGRFGIWNTALRFGTEREACDAAAVAESLGFSALWLPDAGGADLFPRIEALLRATEHITVATGILNLWMHEPAAVSAACATLAETWPGRFLLGIGVSHAPFVEQAGMGNYVKPVGRMIEYLDALDSVTPPVLSQSRILAALGPRMLGIARDRSLGAHPYLGTLEHTATARATLGPGKILAPEVGVVLETDPEKARALARSGMGMYFTLPNYVNSWRRQGFTGNDITAPGSDRLIDALIAWGDEQTIAARLQEHLDAGADHVCVQVLTGEAAAEGGFPVEQWRRLAAALRF